MEYAITSELLRNSRKVFCIDTGDGRVWVKKRRRNKNPLGWWAQRLLYRVSGVLLLQPPQRPVGDNVRFESGVLHTLTGMGMPVPTVLEVAPDYFVMTDTGRRLEKFIAPRRQPNREAADDWVKGALGVLRRLHRLGLAHGGSQVKNFTVLDGKISIIDFEENIPADRVGTFQIRDLFLFVFSLERIGYDPDPEVLCRIYNEGEDLPTWDELRTALRQVKAVRFLEWKIFSGFSMRDVRSLCHLVSKAG